MQLNLLKRRGLALAGLMLVAVLVAACGSSAKSGSSSSHDSLSVTKGSAGTYLVGAKGRSIYLWVADAKDKSHCSSSCLAVWPAVTASGKPTFASGVDAKDVGTITTAGQKQLTYDGHPLYYYAPDASAGETSGQGSDSFGAKWWLVSPTGQAITGHAGSTAKATSSSSSGGGGGY